MSRISYGLSAVKHERQRERELGDALELERFENTLDLYLALERRRFAIKELLNVDIDNRGRRLAGSHGSGRRGLLGHGDG